MHKSYKTFLTTLARASPARPTSRSSGPARACCSLDAFTEAEDVLRRVLKDFTQDPQFLQQPSGRMSLLRTRLKLAAALRGQNKFDEANSLVEELLAQYPKYLEPLVEKGMLLEAEAQAKRGDWAAALRHWQDLARKLESHPPAPARVLRRLVSRRLVAVPAERDAQGAPDAPGRDATDAERRRPRDEGEVRGPARTPLQEVRDSSDVDD